jgi:hypothetical protein
VLNAAVESDRLFMWVWIGCISRKYHAMLVAIRATEGHAHCIPILDACPDLRALVGSIFLCGISQIDGPSARREVQYALADRIFHPLVVPFGVIAPDRYHGKRFARVLVRPIFGRTSPVGVSKVLVESGVNIAGPVDSADR